jgi:biotin-(acetyl-CoA carboxylase) ligase
LRSIATSMIDQLPITNPQLPISNLDPTETLVQLLSSLDLELGNLRQDPASLAARWRPHCLLQRRTIHVAAGPITHVGVCRSIDETGALLLETESGTQRLLSGVVSRF